MNKPPCATVEMIAPCGINCGTCIAFLRSRNRCGGCRRDTENLPVSRQRCIIRNCERRDATASKQCYECELFPCKRLKQLDKRYSTKYHQSLIQNLVTIRESGMKKFLANEARKWTCTNCGATLCVHRENCPGCTTIKPAAATPQLPARTSSQMRRVAKIKKRNIN
jgi:hypothetical protein